MLRVGLALTFIFFLFNPCASLSILNEKETKLALDLLKSLGIRHCICLETVCDFKKFSSEKFFATYFTHDSLIRYFIVELHGLKYLDTSTVHSHKVAIILKEDNVNVVTMVLEEINKIRRTDQMHQLIWIWIAGNSPLTLEGNGRDLILYDCQFIIAQPINSTAYQMREIYMVKTKLFSSYLGIWEYDHGLKLVNVSLYWRRLDLNQTEMIFFTHIALYVPEVLQVFKYFGYMMNFRFVNKFIGPNLPIPEFNLGIRYTVHTYGSNLFVTTGTIGPLFENTVHWYVKYPSVEKKADYYLRPFEIEVWISLAFAILAATFVILLIHALRREEGFILMDGIFMGLDVFSNQSGCKNIIGISIRIICITLRAASLILFASYLAVIMSFLTVETPKAPFKDKETFFENGNYKIYLESVKVFAYLEAELRAYPRLLLEFMPGSGMIPFENTSRICTEKIAYAAIDNDVYKKTIPCKILKIQEPLRVTKSFINLGGSKYKRAFEENLLRYYESGLQDRIQHNISDPFLRKKSTDKDGKVPFQPVAINQMVQVLMVPFFGVGLSVAINFFELLPTFIRKINWEKTRIFLQRIPFCKWRKKRLKEKYEEKKNRFRPALDIGDWYL